MAEYGALPGWQPERPRFRLGGLLVSWLLLTVSLLVAAALVPHVSIPDFRDALVVAIVVGALTAVLPPLVAALRLPYTLIVDFLLVLVVDALILLGASHIDSADIHIAGFGWALVMALVTSAVAVVLEAILGVNRSDVYALRVIRRVAKRADDRVETDAPGVVFLEIDGLALPVLQRAMRDGNAPVLARWAAEGTHRLLEWETDLSSQTGASQAGILLGSNEDIPAFRWVEKETGRLIACSGPADCAEIERRLSTGKGLLANGGASRGNLLSGDADHTILTVSRIEAEKGPNPGYRAFFANGYNVVRTLVLLLWEVVLELTAAARQRRRDVHPRGHRGGIYPLLRAAGLRVRPRPDRLRRPHGHDEGAARDLRDLLELRRGRAPLGPRAPGHARGAAQARPAVRADRRGAAVRAAAVPARHPLRPRADAGRHVQAAERLRPRRARAPLALGRGGGGDGLRRRERDHRRTPPSPRRPASRRRRTRTTSAARASSCSGRATSGSST